MTLKINKLYIYKRLLKMCSAVGMNSGKAFLMKDNNSYHISLFITKNLLVL